jgi:purine-binding chemotaxis protein CheW
MRKTNHKQPERSLTEMHSAPACMPKSKKSKKILKDRAELIAKNLIETVAQTESENYISFYLGENEKYGIDYKYTREVIDNVMLTKLPCAPNFIAGIINRRGALLAVIDLKQLFYNETAEQSKEMSIIIVSSNNITVGILTDHIEGNTRYNPQSLDDPLLSENITKIEFITGLHNANTAIINIEAIIADLQLQLPKSNNVV